MLRNLPAVLLIALAACSSKAPPSGESPATPNGPTAPATGADPMVAQAGAAVAPATAVPPPDPREAALSKIVLRLLEQEHLLRKKVDDGVSRIAFKTYVDRLDGSKMFLLAADHDALARHIDKLDDQMRSGSLDIAHDGAKLFATRVAMVEKLVAEILAAPLDFTNEEYIEIDPKRLELAASETELRERWRRRLELEVLERIAQMEQRLAPKKPDPKAKPGDKPKPDDDDDEADRLTMPLAQIPPTPEGREAKARADIAKTYAGRFARLRNPGPLDAASDVINAVSAALDPHTTYLPPADKANFDIAMTGSLEGIGAVLRERDHYTEVVELVPGGASWRQGGLGPGDLILSVANPGQEPVDVFDLRIDEVVKMIRGKKGTVVRLRVQKPAGHEETIAITRDVVVIEEAYAKGAVLQRKGQAAFGYIHLPSFYGGRDAKRNAANDVRRLLAEMKTRKVTGVILDLRSNGGGLLGDAVEMTGHLIDRGPVVQVQDSRNQREVLGDDQRGLEYDGPMVVMVDRFSASASEIVAGALQDYNRAVVVGTTTHGKGTVQTLADLDRAAGGKIELGVLKITIQQFFRISGSSTQREGVVPDIILPDPAGHIDSGERELEHAVAWSQTTPATHTRWPVTWNTSSLVQKSANRVAKNPLLAKIASTTQILKARAQDTKVPLARPAWETRRKEQRAALDAASPDLKHAPANFTVKPIEDPAIKPTVPGPGGRKDDRAIKWSDALARDPWIDESVHILGDMTTK
ncbi:MAG: carboxy terminal-processing peptidase [Deltaproteobacteria bacterium]|nr:carboxy terminal-processing peptidase [Deltaproteobacteria bacterium]MDQ3298774.1 carboxy terminal-processing peptidase [Myxococcota bacterium]